MRTEGRALWLLFMAVAVAACGAPAPTVPATLARPDVPQGWTTIASDEGDLWLTVPPDFEPVSTVSGVLAQPPVQDDGKSMLEVWATGPVAVPQPEGGEPIRRWLDRNGWAPVSGGSLVIEEITERELVLPSGRALELVLVAQPGTDEASRLVIYAIATEEGFGIVRIIGSPPRRLDERASELELVPLLVKFGDEGAD